MKTAVGGNLLRFWVKKNNNVSDGSRLVKSHQKEGIRLEEPSGEESRGVEAGGGSGGFQIIGLKQNDWDKTVSWLLCFPHSRSRFKILSALLRKQQIPSRPIWLQRETTAISLRNLWATKEQQQKPTTHR